MPLLQSVKDKLKSLTARKKHQHQLCIGYPTKKAARNKLSTTKYNAWNFLPKFLFQKFTEPTNAFFLILTLLKLNRSISPFAWHSSGVPLAVIILFGGLTEIYEDLKRRWEDRRLNNLKVDYFDGEWKQISWRELKEGHVVRICKGDQVPADLLVVSSSEPGGEVYMETANLDGEANLKVRQSPVETMDINSEERLKCLLHSKSTVSSDQPTRAIEEFNGVLHLNGPVISIMQNVITANNPTPEDAKIPLNGTNLVVRGATLQNTDWMIGVVIFGGKRTKLGMNSTKKSTKTSQVHRLTNWLIFIQIGWLLTSSALIAFWNKMHSNSWMRAAFGNLNVLKDDLFNLGDKYDEVEPNYFALFFGELILSSNLVPISLCVTIEFCLAWQAYYMQQDLDLYDPELKKRLKVHSFGTIPNLGVIKYVMSDKTGTLTMNKMKFKLCSITGQKYGKSNRLAEFNTDLILRDLKTDERKNSSAIDLFLTSCAVCHTVIAGHDRNKAVSTPDAGETSLSRRKVSKNFPKAKDPLTPQHIYHACSPDEACLVRFACSSNYVFTSRTPSSINVEVHGVRKVYDVLAIIEFTSTRKRMSILVRTPEGVIRLFVKGADVKILAMLGPNSDPTVLSTTQSHLKEFANQGYRTLCFGYRDVSQEDAWAPLWTKVSCDLEDRQKQIELVAEKLEKKLILLGASAIEDKLQDRVPQTISQPFNLGYSCSLLTPRKPIFILAAKTEKEMEELLDSYVDTIGDQLAQKEAQVGLIVDAHCLDWILGSKVRKMDFLRIALGCSAVICCRCTPLQKASVTRLLKRNIDGLVLGIGDGANDVAMIQEADVGVGIAGLEGSQASNAADFAITQFRHLDRLLFVHGTSNYYRITTLVLFFLYKNLVEVCLNIAYSFYNDHSDQGMADEYTIVRYNMIYTCLAVFVIGIHDSPAPFNVLAKFPRLYTHFQENMSNKNYLLWSGNAILHALIIYTALVNWWRDGCEVFTSGRDGWGQMFGTYTYMCLVIIVNAKAVIGSRSITFMTGAAFVASIFSVFLFLFTDSLLFPFTFPVVAPNKAHYLGLIYTLPSWQTAFFLPFICVVCLLPDILFTSAHRTLNPSLLLRVVQSLKKKDTIVDKIILGPFVRMTNIFGLKEELEGGTNGFSFAQDDGQAISQSALLRMYGAPSCKSEVRVQRSNIVAEQESYQLEEINKQTTPLPHAEANINNNDISDNPKPEIKTEVINEQ
ncbi:unnamed protein product, partial [Mesorhabditis belari]|uniref:Phospholipid-transporting ATPase n=1 Tax=Mesorhabditis belari TaxID=2138241 RepID=A0AAF3FFA6_9BILA